MGDPNVNKFLASLSAAIEYILDREGELSEAQDVNPITRVRYTSTREVPYIDYVVDGRTVRVTAEDMGPHTHTFNGPDCTTCGYYDEEREDENLGTCSKCLTLNPLNGDGLCLNCSVEDRVETFDKVVLTTFTGTDVIDFFGKGDRKGEG